MSNSLYNEEIKKQYLDTRKSRATYENFFRKSHKEEKKVNKDICNFTKDEVLRMLIDFEYTDRSNILLALSAYRGYIDWILSEKKELKTDLENQLYNIDSSTIELAIDKTKKKKIITESQLGLLEDIAVENAQDAVIPRLIFEGLEGTDYSELINLKYSDVNFRNKTITVTQDDGNTRIIEASSTLLDLIRDASREDVYVTKAVWKDSDQTHLLDSPYILKKIKKNSGNTDDIRIASHTIRRRIDLFRSEGFEFITTKKIKKSGMLYMAKRLYERDGKLEHEQWDMIGRQFNLKKSTNEHGGKFYQLGQIRKDINIETIKELYNL